MNITLKQFTDTRVDMNADAFEKVYGTDFLNADTIKVLTYMNGLFIEQSPGGLYSLELDRSEYTSEDLVLLEQKLYQFYKQDTGADNYEKIEEKLHEVAALLAQEFGAQGLSLDEICPTTYGLSDNQKAYKDLISESLEHLEIIY